MLNFLKNRSKEWRSAGSTEQFVVERSGTVRFSAGNVQFEYLALGQEQALEAGLYRIRITGAIEEGRCAVGLLDVQAASWLSMTEITGPGELALPDLPLLEDKKVQVIVSASNFDARRPVKGAVGGLKIQQIGDASAARSARSKSDELVALKAWRRDEQPAILMRALDQAIAAGAAAAVNGYRVTEAPTIGYAARSLLPVDAGGDGFFVLIANAGDESISLLKRDSRGALAPVGQVFFPQHSTPIDLTALPGPNGVELGICFFHMAAAATEFGVTGFGTLPFSLIIERAAAGGAVRKEEINFLHQRDGHWGARNGAMIRDAGHGDWLAVNDRDGSQVWFLQRPTSEASWRLPAAVLPLEPGFDPVGVTGIALAATGRPVFYVASRLLPKLLVIAPGDAAGAAPEILQTVDIGGLSRSSVAIGDFDGSGRRRLAVGLWGGDPREVSTPFEGEVFHAEIDDTGRIANPRKFKSGTNTTDVVAGDLDGDGRDELVVLNYGAGLNLEERSDVGDVRVFKAAGGTFDLAATLELPTPRIGTVADFDGDGKVELGATLFFEKRLPIVKFER